MIVVWWGSGRPNRTLYCVLYWKDITLLGQTDNCCHTGFDGRTVEALVEEPSKTAVEASTALEAFWSHVLQVTDRVHDDRIFVFEGTRRKVGQFLAVAIYDTIRFTLFGAFATGHLGPRGVSVGWGHIRLVLC